ncbi:MAG: alanine--glyoxylate aminotransferase family protein [Phycisphaeraceae bacterium]|nr:alanine--glyoxylate aminotransferase family protein [Phycisphaeraceae bacterium]
MVLLTPGPTPVPQQVLEAMARPILHHRTPEFEAIVRSMSGKLARVFSTANPVLTIPGTGTTACESTLLSLTRPREIVATFANGKFGSRWGSVFRRLGLEVFINDIQIDSPWGSPVDPDALARYLHSEVGRRTSVFAFVHCETSTATVNDLRTLCGMIRERNPGAIIVADCITSIGAIPVEPDAWGIDVAVCASQKALRNAPGLGFVSVSERARERLGHADRLAPLSMSLGAYLKGHEKGSLPFTAPVSNIVAQDAALDLVLGEGLQAIHEKTSRLARATREALTAMGLRIVSSSPSDSVTAAGMPDGSREGLADEIRSVCKESSKVHLAGGQNEWAGKVIRISHMGAVTAADTINGIEAIASALRELGPIDGANPDAGPALIRSALEGTIASESVSRISA